MSREIDVQDQDGQRFEKAVSTASEQTRFVGGLEPPKGFFVQRALEHLRNIGGTLGLEPTQPAEFAADHQIHEV